MKSIPERRLIIRNILLVLALINISMDVLCQHVDTLKRGKIIEDKPIEEKEKSHSPKTASIMSAILPGLGQVYNKKYWKPPIIYAGFAALIYATDFNNKNYNDYKEAYSLRMDGDSETVDKYDVQLDNEEIKYSDESLLKLKDFYRRNRDLTLIFIGGTYLINILDAVVDAHFYSFNVSDDLSFELRPNIIYQCAHERPVPSLGLTLNL
ncbi:MAG TPA: hypothetical protein EYM84_01845 [Flavobacteriales bacterium]|nr:hypothetical protein [Flavobacteriales bacterium]